MAYGVQLSAPYTLIGGPREADARYPRRNEVYNPDFNQGPWLSDGANLAKPTNWERYDNSPGDGGAQWLRVPYGGPHGQDAWRVFAPNNTSNKGFRQGTAIYAVKAGESWYVGYWLKTNKTPVFAYNLAATYHTLASPALSLGEWRFHATRVVENSFEGAQQFDAHHLGFQGTNVDAYVAQPHIVRIPNGPIPNATEVARNLVLNPQFEYGTSLTVTSPLNGWYWYNSGTATGTRALVVSSPVTGVGYGRRIAGISTPAGTGSIGWYTHTNVDAIEAGRTYTMSAYAAVAGAGPVPVTVHVEWLNISGQIIGSMSSSGFNATGTWSRPFVTGVAPAGAVQARVYAWFTGAGSFPGAPLYVDGFMMNEGSLINYFDGGTAKARWMGEPHLSESVLYDREVGIVPSFSGDTPGYTWYMRPEETTLLPTQDGTRAVLNNDTDPDFVGYVADVSGLEAAEVRESSVDNIEADGAIHGEFYQGRRPFSITAQVGGNVIPAVRNERLQRWFAASRALRRRGVSHREAVLRWEPDAAPAEFFVRARRQQPTRATGTYLKESPVALVAQDPRYYGTTLYTNEHTPSGSGTAGRTYDRSYDVNYNWAPARGDMTVTNLGDADAPVLIVFSNGMSTVALQNLTTEEEISINGSIVNGQSMTVDTHRRSIVLQDGTNIFDRIELPRTRWWGLAPGPNVLRFLAETFDGTARVLVTHRPAWA